LAAGSAFADARQNCIIGSLKLGFSEKMTEKLCNFTPSQNTVDCAKDALGLGYSYRDALQACWQQATESTGKCLVKASTLQFNPSLSRQLCAIATTPDRIECAQGILEAGGRHMFAVKTCHPNYEKTKEMPE